MRRRTFRLCSFWSLFWVHTFMCTAAVRKRSRSAVNCHIFPNQAARPISRVPSGHRRNLNDHNRGTDFQSRIRGGECGGGGGRGAGFHKTGVGAVAATVVAYDGCVVTTHSPFFSFCVSSVQLRRFSLILMTAATGAGYTERPYNLQKQPVLRRGPQGPPPGPQGAQPGHYGPSQVHNIPYRW